MPNYFKVTILGSGTSTGVPVPTCKCSVCQSSDPKNYRDRTSALITFNNGTNLLIDASPDLRQQSLKFNIEKIDGILFTHSHYDHIGGIDDLRVFCFRDKKSIPCFANKQTQDNIKAYFAHIFRDNANYKGGMLTKISFNTIEPYIPFEINSIKIMPFLLKHGDLDVLGFKVGNFAYATDCNFMPQQTKDMLQNISYLILDGLRYEPHNTHFSIPEAIKVSAEINAKKTYLIHTTHTIDYETTSKKLPNNVFLAYDGLILNDLAY